MKVWMFVPAALVAIAVVWRVRSLRYSNRLSDHWWQARVLEERNKDGYK